MSSSLNRAPFLGTQTSTAPENKDLKRDLHLENHPHSRFFFNSSSVRGSLVGFGGFRSPSRRALDILNVEAHPAA